jgi:hypothetical protein
MLIVPGADDIQLYQPTHKVAYDLGNGKVVSAGSR